MATDNANEETRDPHSELLWQPGRKLDDASFLGEAVTEEEPESWVEPSTEQLEAYRRSELKSLEREAVEEALLRDPATRARLVALSDLDPQVAPSASRERALAAFDREFATQDSSEDSSRARATEQGARVLPWRRSRDLEAVGSPSSRARSLRPAWAALAAAMLAVLVWIGSPSTEPLPEGLHWQVQAQGAAEVRSHPVDSHPVDPATPDVDPLRLDPSTVLRLDASPSRAIAELDVSLFRLRAGETPQRLGLTDSMLTLDRGAARIEATTSDLLGSESESGWLILVLSRPGAEPSAEELGQALRSSGPGRVSGDTSQASGNTVVRPLWRAHSIAYELTDS